MNYCPICFGPLDTGLNCAQGHGYQGGKELITNVYTKPTCPDCARMKDELDLMRDEFQRIKNCPDCNSEIAGLCDRAVSKIERNVPLAKENERLQSDCARLKALLEDMWSAYNKFDSVDKDSVQYEEFYFTYKNIEARIKKEGIE